MAFFIMARQGGHKAIVNTAAASELGQMINRLGQSEGIQVIHIVRRDAQVELLKRQGASAVLNSSEPDFLEQFRDACHQYGARLAFDSVAGVMTENLLEVMPDGSKVIVYGQLSKEPIRIDAGRLFADYKSLSGYYLSTWFATRNMMQNLMLWRRAKKRLLTELKTHIRSQIPLRDVQKAVRDYQSNMTGGKMLLRPDL